MDDISKVSNAELSKQLKSHDLPSGPITKTTRPLFERKLRKHLAGSDSSETSMSKDGSPKDESQQVGDNNHDNANGDSNIEPSEVNNHIDIRKEETSGAETAKQFYSIQLPKDMQGAGVVLTDRHEALKELKKKPGSRLKIFTSREDAVSFSEQPESGSVTVCQKSSGSEVKVFTPVVPGKLKRTIEGGDIEAVRSLIWSNPRYLIGSGDTPVIIQVGFHYNALHVAAVKNQPAICQLILEALEDLRYVKMLYPDESSETDQQCINFLLDLYLNTPDKGNCETPLHFACKFGHTDVVDVLASHPRTDKSVVNRDGNSPKDVICERVPRASGEVREKIAQSLEDPYFVPLLRAEDDSKTPQIGALWTPSKTHLRSSSVVPSSPMESPVTVKAYAGPMGSAKAKEFQKWWRYRKSVGRSATEHRQFLEIKRSDYEKGLERIGRMMAHDMGISWSEYWDFLDCFTDLSTTDGLHKLEAYLQQLHESENELASQDNALLQMEQQMDRLSLGPQGTPSHGPRDPSRVLRCWGTPPGVYGSGDGRGEEEGREKKQRDRTIIVMGTSGESESVEVESETKVLAGGGGEVRSERVVLTDVEAKFESTVLAGGGRNDKRETKVDGDNEINKNIASTNGNGCVNSETTLSVDEGEVKKVDDGRDVENESRDVETNISSSNDDIYQQCETRKEKSKVNAVVHNKDYCHVSCDVSQSTEETSSGPSTDTELSPVSTQVGDDTTPQVTTRDMTGSNVTNHMTSCQTHGPDSKSCHQLSTEDGSTIISQNATVVIAEDTSCTIQVIDRDVSEGKHIDALKDGTVYQGVAPGCSAGVTGQSSPEGSVHADLPGCTNEGLNATFDTTDTTHVLRTSQNTTRDHDRGDGIDNDVFCNSHSVKIDGGDANILPCRTKSHVVIKDTPPPSVSNPASKGTVGTNATVTCVSPSASSVTDKTEVSSHGSGTEQSYKNTTKPKDSSSGSDDVCSVCSSVSSYHTARDNVDFDYASLDDLFVPSRSQSPSRLPPVFILGSTPSKKDLDVLRALENAFVSPDDHPRVTQWRHLVLSYSEEARKTWSTPMRQRKLLGSHVTPTLDTTPLGISSPIYTDHVTTSGSSESSQSDADDFSRHRDMRNVRANLLSSFSSF